ncbi:9967_t:CDS:2 [Racocetra fulgida]|uniref:9967_t:CDS:1 n=1 Tax=Racocetra fulgida TaxID=60492 RepID=A0A9N8Z7S3_9GLOM|nr:9967_t:CDS:2 [Racocetra fulgida]
MQAASLSTKIFNPSRHYLRIRQNGKIWNSKLTVFDSSSNDKIDKFDSDKIVSDPITKFEHSPSHKDISFRNLILSIKQYAITAFMPKDYHDSVTKDYWGFAKWQFFHNIAGSVTGGQLGGVVYAASINNRFDSEPKRHRFQSVIVMQWASLLEFYRSNLYVTTNTLNVPRAEMILYGILRQFDERANISLPDKGVIKNLIPTPKNISSREIFVGYYHSLFNIPLVIEPALHHYTSQEYTNNLLTSLTHKGFIHSEEYFILHAPNRSLGNKQHVVLWFSQNAKSKDMIKGFYHACVIRYLLEGYDLFKLDKDYNDFIFNIMKISHEWVEDSFEVFLKVLVKKNWEIEHTFLTDKNDHRISIDK